jgi:hypothetical protein
MREMVGAPGQITYTGLFMRGVLLNFYFAATNNTNGSNY